MWNILENVDKQYENPDDRVKLIKKIIDIEDKDLKDKTLYSPKIKEIIGSIASEQAKEQAEEEAEKAIQMQHNDQSMPNDWNEETLGPWKNWNDAIEKAEECAFFHGSIRFLYEKIAMKKPLGRSLRPNSVIARISSPKMVFLRRRR